MYETTGDGSVEIDLNVFWAGDPDVAGQSPLDSFVHPHEFSLRRGAYPTHTRPLCDGRTLVLREAPLKQTTSQGCVPVHYVNVAVREAPLKQTMAFKAGGVGGF